MARIFLSSSAPFFSSLREVSFAHANDVLISGGVNMDTRTTPYKHDFRALPAVKGLRQRPSPRVCEILLAPIDDETLFGLIEKASHRGNAQLLIRALISLRNPRKRLTRGNLELLRRFGPLEQSLDSHAIAKIDAENFIIWRHNAIVRMVAGQRSVEETMRLLRVGGDVDYAFANDDLPEWGGLYTIVRMSSI